MICPHCGRKTDTGETCRYCHRQTEFISRTCSRPGKIPGIDERSVARPENPASSSGLLAVILVVAVITCALEILGVLQLRQLRAATSAAQAPVYTVCFDRNLPEEQGADVPSISRGQTVPTLQDTGSWRFTGWNTKPEGNGMGVNPGDPFDLPLWEPLTLYAQWEPVPEVPTEAEASLPEAEETPPSTDTETEPARE